jgi:hypothetical protein
VILIFDFELDFGLDHPVPEGYIYIYIYIRGGLECTFTLALQVIRGDVNGSQCIDHWIINESGAVGEIIVLVGKLALGVRCSPVTSVVRPILIAPA